MTRGSRQTISAAIGLWIVCWLGLAVASAKAASGTEASAKAAQAGLAQTPQTSDTVFKNVQVLKGIPVDQFMDAMGMFSASLGYDCSSCHSTDIHTDPAAFPITTPLLTKARPMIAMMNG